MNNAFTDSFTTAFKGGPGSGFTSEAGHMGRPGKRGGSQPGKSAKLTPGVNRRVFFDKISMKSLN
jgi:hypothetical protein